MRRLLAIVALGGLLAVAVTILYAQGRAGLESERLRLEAETRTAQVAVLEGIRQELAGELKALVERESTRPYYQYGNLYLPPDVLSNQAALVPSPLANEPQEPLVQVYFQYRQDGFSTPTVANGMLDEADQAPEYRNNAYAQQAVAELKLLAPDVLRSCGDLLLQPEEGEPSITQVDPLVADANRNPEQFLDQIADAQMELEGSDNTGSKTQVQMNQAWQGYQSRGGNKLDYYGKGKQSKQQAQTAQTAGGPEDERKDAQQLEATRKRQEQEKKGQQGGQQALPQVATQSVPLRVYPFRTVKIPGEEWPQHLLVTRRVELQDEAWLQGFSVDLAQVRSELLPRAIKRYTEPVSEPIYGSRGTLGSGPPAKAPPPVEVWSTSAASVNPGVTLPLLHPFEELSLVHVGGTDPTEALAGSHMLLNGALVLVGIVILAGSMILLFAARGQRKLAQQRADFVAALTHELKAPLTGVRALTELLHDGIITDEEKKQEYYASMLGECDRLSRLVHNVLSAARLERGSLPVVIEPLDPLPILVHLAERFGARLDTAGFTFEVVLPDALPQVLADREGFDHIVANLLDNAAKYGLGETKLVRLEATVEGESILVAVADRGPGIPLGEREKVFGRFFRSPDVPREVGGAGLGLAIALAHVEAQNGTLQAVTNPGGGARFELRLPLVPKGLA